MFTLEIIGYLYLGGMGGAALALVCGFDLLSQKRMAQGGLPSDSWEQAFSPRFYAGAFLTTGVVLVAGTLLLILDLGQPQRFLYVLIHPTFSVLTFGSYALFLSLLATIFLTLVALFGFYSVSFKVVQVAEWIGILAGVSTAVYSGLFLVQFDFVSLWANPFIPLLFAFSSLSSATGLLLIMVVMLGKNASNVVKLFFRVDRIAILLELLSLVGYFAFGIFCNAEEFAIGLFIVREEATLFWLGFVGLGIFVPLILEGLYKKLPTSLLLGFTAFCLLLGGFVLRWCMITLPYYGF